MKNGRLPVEVEAPSDARWERIGRELFAKLDAGAPVAPGVDPTARRGPRRVALWVSGGAMAAAAMLVVGTLVHSRHLSGEDHRARLETTDGASQFTVGESSLIVGPRSLVMVEGDDEHGIDVVLDRGEVTCIVAPRRGRPPFLVEAGDARVRVVGTRFTVTRHGEGASVDVDRGVVEVAAHGVVAALHDGEHWPLQATGTAPAPAAVEAPVAAAAASGGPAPSEAVVAPRAPRSLPREPSSGARDVPVASVASAPPPTAPSAQDQFETATRIERARPDDAMALYGQVARGGSAWAPNALFALARLEADRGRRSDASQHLQQYLSRYPRGLNADDARALLDSMR